MSYRIQPSDKFSRSVSDAKKAYYKKNTAKFVAFLQVVADFLKDLEENGAHCSGAQPERFPNAASIPGWDLSKFYFKMPALKGAAGEGRIIFVVNKTMLVGYPLIFYTHAEYTKRPPDKDLTKLVNAALADAIAKSKPNESALDSGSPEPGLDAKLEER